MARIVGVELPREKRVEAGIQAIYGIGPSRARQLMAKTGIDPDTRVRDLTDEEVNKISNAIQSDYKVEGDLRRDITANIKRLNGDCRYGGSARIPMRARVRDPAVWPSSRRKNRSESNLFPS